MAFNPITPIAVGSFQDPTKGLRDTITNQLNRYDQNVRFDQLRADKAQTRQDQLDRQAVLDERYKQEQQLKADELKRKLAKETAQQQLVSDVLDVQKGTIAVPGKDAVMDTRISQASLDAQNQWDDAEFEAAIAQDEALNDAYKRRELAIQPAQQMTRRGLRNLPQQETDNMLPWANIEAVTSQPIDSRFTKGSVLEALDTAGQPVEKFPASIVRYNEPIVAKDTTLATPRPKVETEQYVKTPATGPTERALTKDEIANRVRSILASSEASGADKLAVAKEVGLLGKNATSADMNLVYKRLNDMQVVQDAQTLGYTGKSTKGAETFIEDYYKTYKDTSKPERIKYENMPDTEYFTFGDVSAEDFATKLVPQYRAKGLSDKQIEIIRNEATLGGTRPFDLDRANIALQNIK